MEPGVIPGPISMRKERPSAQQIADRSALLARLSVEDRQKLAVASRVAHAERGEVLWLSGAQVSFFGVIHDGFVKMAKTGPDGSEATIELMGPGQVFGMLGAVTGTGCPLAAIAVTNLWYLQVPKSSFLPVYQTSASLKDALITRSASRLHGIMQLMARLAGGSVEQKLAAVVLILSDSYGEVRDGAVSLQVPLTRQELADMAGTTVESAIRVMSRWQKAGIISTERRLLTILDEGRLHQLVSQG